MGMDKLYVQPLFDIPKHNDRQAKQMNPGCMIFVCT